jgi:hypothetical protein
LQHTLVLGQNSCSPAFLAWLKSRFGCSARARGNRVFSSIAPRLTCGLDLCVQYCKDPLTAFPGHHASELPSLQILLVLSTVKGILVGNSLFLRVTSDQTKLLLIPSTVTILKKTAGNRTEANQLYLFGLKVTMQLNHATNHTNRNLTEFMLRIRNSTAYAVELMNYHSMSFRHWLRARQSEAAVSSPARSTLCSHMPRPASSAARGTS